MIEDLTAADRAVIEIEAVIRVRLPTDAAVRFASHGSRAGPDPVVVDCVGLYCPWPRATVRSSTAVAPDPSQQEHSPVTAIGKAATGNAPWHRLIDEAQTVWESAPAIDGECRDSRFRRLVQLFQLRRRISEAESEQRLRNFFSRHFPVSGAPFRRE